MNLNLPEDFTTLCTIYQIKPETMIQSFIDQVSFPGFYYNPTGRNRWATYFFLHFLDTEESKYEVDRELENKYLRIFNHTILQMFDQKEDESKAKDAARKVMRQWLKAALAERTRYITDNL